MDKKRPIDRLRESGGSITIRGDGEKSRISDFYKIGEKQFFVMTETGIYEVKMPDQIDPQRTNLHLQPTQQRVVDYGVNDDIVCRVLLTAKTLFEPRLLGQDFDYAGASALAFEALKDLISMRQLQIDLAQDQKHAMEKYNQRSRSDNSVLLPSIPNIKSRCDMYMQKANHALNCIERLAKLFYADSLKAKWITGLEKLSEERYGKDNALFEFMKRASPFLFFINNTRNSVEHPIPSKQMIVEDFLLQADGSIVAPTVEVLHPDTPQAAVQATAFMANITDKMVSATEEMMAHLCGSNAQLYANMPIYVVEYPVEKRPNQQARFHYALELNGRLVPFG